MNALAVEAPTLAALIASWLGAKDREAAANMDRVAIEEQIVARLGKKPEGAQTHDVGAFKVTVTGKLTRSVNLDQLDEIVRLNADKVAGLIPVKTKRELDEVGCRWLEANRPDVWALLSPAITVKPAKTGVSVKEVA